MSPRPTLLRRLSLSALVLAALLLSGTARAANDIVLRITTATGGAILAGESTVTNHGGEIDVLGFSWGVSAPRAPTGGGTVTATANYLTMTKRVDKASPTLMVAVFSGVHYPTAVLFIRNQAGTALDFFKVTMTDIVVNSYDTSAAGDGSLLETVSISFGTIKFDFQPQNADGTANGAVISAGWNITQNRSL